MWWYGAAAAAAQQMLTPPAPTEKKWLGDEFTPNCIIVAVANHLLHAKGVTADETSMRELTEACPEEPTIEEVLWKAWMMHWPRNSTVHLAGYSLITGPTQNIGGLVVGYKSEYGDHAALSLTEGKVVSWGSVSECEAEIEEAWELTWVN